MSEDLDLPVSGDAALETIVLTDDSSITTPTVATKGHLYKRPSDNNLYWATLGDGEVKMIPASDIEVDTTDATTTTALTVATSSDVSYHLDITIIAKEDDGSDSAHFHIRAPYTNNSGTVALVATATSETFKTAGAATWTVTTTISTTNVLVRVTGEAATNISWRGSVIVTVN